MREIIPEEVVRVLSLHGASTLVAGPPGKEVAARMHLAPFEDVVFALAPRNNHVLAALMNHCNAEIQARAPDKSYLVHLKGRAAVGPVVATPPRRMENLPWLPEGGHPRGLVVVTFFCESMEYRKRREGGNDQVFAGVTRLGTSAPAMGKRWFQAAYGGIYPLLVLSLAAFWLFMATLGHEYPMRYPALLIGATSIATLQAGARLWYRATAYLRWLEGRAHADEAGQFTTGLLAANPSRRMSYVLTVTGAILCLILYMWPKNLALVTFGFSMAWLLWPMWTLHLAQKTAEPRDL